jgi:hypothetical protein
LSGETGLSFPKVVNIVIREGLIRLGKIPESTSQAHLLINKPFIEAKKEVAEVKPASKPKPARPDYSKMSLEQLESLRSRLMEAGESTEIQFVAAEIKKRLAEKGVKS